MLIEKLGVMPPGGERVKMARALTDLVLRSKAACTDKSNILEYELEEIEAQSDRLAVDEYYLGYPRLRFFVRKNSDRTLGGMAILGLPGSERAKYLKDNVAIPEDVLRKIERDEKNNNEGMLHWLFVEARLKGKGCGRALWREVVTEAKSANLKFLTFGSEPTAVQFYKKVGGHQLVRITKKKSPTLKNKNRISPSFRYYLR